MSASSGLLALIRLKLLGLFDLDAAILSDLMPLDKEIGGSPMMTSASKASVMRSPSAPVPF
jgi:hypothetical protein